MPRPLEQNSGDATASHKQVCLQLPTSAVIVTLLAFAAVPPLPLLGAWRPQRSVDYRMSRAGLALSSKPAAAAGE